jgi:hypothetical protein
MIPDPVYRYPIAYNPKRKRKEAETNKDKKESGLMLFPL